MATSILNNQRKRLSLENVHNCVYNRNNYDFFCVDGICYLHLEIYGMPLTSGKVTIATVPQDYRPKSRNIDNALVFKASDGAFVGYSSVTVSTDGDVIVTPAYSNTDGFINITKVWAI